MLEQINMNTFKVTLRKRNITEEELIIDLKRCAEQINKDTLTSKEYSEIGNFGVNTFLRRFKSWNSALELAGLIAPNRQYISDVETFENIASVWTHLGRQPFGKEMDKSLGCSKISLGTYEKRFGSWNNALIAFSNYINDGTINEDKKIEATPIKLSKRTDRKVSWRLRVQVLIRDNCICQMCGASPAKDPSITLHADHIKPWSKGGETVLENLQTLCHICNLGKGDLYD